MIESIDDHLIRRLQHWEATATPGAPDPRVSSHDLVSLLEAQIQARHLDFAGRWLQSKGQGFYTIGSAGHESNAVVAMALRPTDPALLHYRSGGFFAARAAQVPGSNPVTDVLSGMATSASDPISGGRHKVFGHPDYAVIPQTSTIGSHLPRAVGLAFSLGRAHALDLPAAWPDDAIVVCSFGDASANHSTSVGALNSASWCSHQGVPLPLLFVCEDNGIGISTKTPSGWTARALSSLPAIDYVYADGSDPEEALATARDLAERVRSERRPAVLHLRTVRFMGHAGSDAELAYRSRTEILADYGRDPILATVRALVLRGAITPEAALERYEVVRRGVAAVAETMVDTKRLDSAVRVMAPIAYPRVMSELPLPRRDLQLPGQPGLTLAQAINATLGDELRARPEATVFGEDVAIKGGVYGVTRGLRKAFGAGRVFDTLLDEQSILGTALGAALTGLLPIPEIQYLAYLHNAEDQLRGEAATLAFFSDGQYRNGMVVRIAGLAYQRGFGGHFHNDNSVAVLRDIPGLILAVPSHPADAPELLRTCIALARQEGRVCVFLEPIALYHRKDLHRDGDLGWVAPQEALSSATPRESFGRARAYGTGQDLLIITFGNGLPMSLRAAERLAQESISTMVLDLRWLAPLPTRDIVRTAAAFKRVLVVDETRRSGGVAESVLAALTDAGFQGRAARVSSEDSFIPLGPAAETVLLGEDVVVQAARDVCRVAGD
ncbi:MAG TPA: thiamine pyrophosphate-dependent enzyme [Nocardioidaceae bacterium]|nr:thiamine pyrophosphate-dependent enzyme [Nocardioidaceae bacterium]